MARRRRNLGSPKAAHARESEHAAESVRSAINRGVAALKRGSCHGAQGFITAAYEAMGSMHAHGRSAGNNQFLPQRALMDLNGKFNDVCLIADKVDVGRYWSPALAGGRRRRRRTGR